MLGVEFILYCVYSSPPTPSTFYSTEHSWKHNLFSWDLWSWSMPESPGQVILQKAWNCAQWPWSNWVEWTQQHLIWLVPFATWSESVCVCLLPTDLRGNLVFSEVLCQSLVMGLEWVERVWQEEWSQLAWDSFRVRKSRPSSYSTMSMFYGPLTVFLMETWCLQKKPKRGAWVAE